VKECSTTKRATDISKAHESTITSQQNLEMDSSVLETPVRKRARSDTPSTRSSSRVNKRLRSKPTSSPSPKIVRFDDCADDDMVMESDVPESPVQLRSIPTLVAPTTPKTPALRNPFSKLTLNTPSQSKLVTTPASKVVKSVKKSARKTPGSVKPLKLLPFRINVVLSGMCLPSLPRRHSSIIP
jgi:hypothetical protein